MGLLELGDNMCSGIYGRGYSGFDHDGHLDSCTGAALAVEGKETMGVCTGALKPA